MSFVTPEGIGLGNYVRYVNSPKFAEGRRQQPRGCRHDDDDHGAARLCVCLRDAQDGDAASRVSFGSIALLPLFAPSLVQALGIVFLFGRNGVINRTFGLAIDIYGFWGIVISDVFYSFPHAYLILSAALAVADARLYESAQVLGATSARIFRDITLAIDEIRHPVRDVRRVHDRDHRLRQPDGDWRRLQRAGDRDLQPGVGPG